MVILIEVLFELLDLTCALANLRCLSDGQGPGCFQSSFALLFENTVLLSFLDSLPLQELQRVAAQLTNELLPVLVGLFQLLEPYFLVI